MTRSNSICAVANAHDVARRATTSASARVGVRIMVAVADEAESRRRRERRRLAALETETRAARAEESAAREARRRREALHRRTPQNPPGAFSVFAPPRDADPRGYDFQTPPPQRAPRHHLAAPYEGAGYGDPEYDHHHHPATNAHMHRPRRGRQVVHGPFISPLQTQTLWGGRCYE